MKILVAFATTHGSTGEIARFIGDVLKEHNLDVTVASVETVDSVQGYDAFVLGTPIYGGLWLTQMSQFLKKFTPDMAGKPVYFWINCIRVLEPDGREHAQREYVYRPTLDELGVGEVAVFAGKLKLDEIDWSERWTLAARYDGDVVPGTRNDDYRDWNAIRDWAEQIRDRFSG